MPLNLAPVLKVQGVALSAAHLSKLSHLRVERGIRLMGRLTLRFYDEGFGIAKSATFALGTEISVSTDEGKLLMVGIVTGTQIEQHRGDVPTLLVTADDAAVALTRGSRVTTYADMTYSDVVGRLLQHSGIVGDVSATSLIFPYLIQSGSDLQFLEDIADRTGCDWWVGGADGKTVIFAPPKTAPPVATVSLGADLIEFSVRANGLHPTEVTVTGWEGQKQAAVASSAVPITTTPGAAPKIDDARFAAHITSAGPLKEASATTAALGATSSAEATQLASAIGARAAAAAVTARGTMDVSGVIEPGATVTVADAGPGSGDYRITRVEHIYSSKGFITKFTAGERRPSALVDVLGQRPASAFAHQGLVTGTVSDITDPEDYGRVRVLINGLTTSDTSAWARVATHGAGQGRGFVVMPEVGDEVLVGFEDADTRRPVIIGGLFGDKGKMTSYGVESNQTVGRQLVSRLGYRMEISDGTTPEKQHVRLSLEQGEAHMVRLGKDKLQVTVPDGVPVEIKAGANASFIIDNMGNVAIKGKKITLDAQQGVAISSAAGPVSASAPSSELKLEGMRFVVKGSAAGEVTAGGSLAVKGAIVQIN